MIAIRAVLSTFPPQPFFRLTALLLAVLLLAGCVPPLAPGTYLPDKPPVTTGYFTMPDGAKLPYRAWLPDGAPRAVVLALHGMNDSRDAWEYPAPDFAREGIAVFSPDQRGFGTAPDRGLWAGSGRMVDDARHMARTLRVRYPHTRLILMGESMGGAVLMVLAAQPDPPPVDGYVVIAPAVWGRAEMSLFLRAGLWLLSNTFPAVTVTGPFAPSAAPPTEMPGPKFATDVPLIQLVYWPVIVTLTAAFGVPMFGLMTVMTGVPGRTVKPLFRFRFCEPVVTLTVRAPTVAFAAMLILAVSCVALATVMKLVVIPEPKPTVEVACAKLEKAPSITTLRVAPAVPVPGVAEVSAGTPARTEKPPVMLATWPPVVTVTLREAIVAVGLMVMFATASVASETVSELTVMPAPKFATLVLLTHAVYRPVSATLIVVP